MHPPNPKASSLPALAPGPLRTVTHTVIAGAMPLFTCLLATMMGRSVFSPLLLPLEQAFGLSHAVAGLLFLVIAFGYVPGMYLSGFISARIGHRRTIVAALLAAVTGLLVAAATPWAAGVFVGVAVIGAGAGVYFPSGVAVVTRSVARPQWGRALAIHEAGPSTGMVLAPVLVVALMGLIGWRGVLVLHAAIGLLAVLVFLKTARRSRFRGRSPTLGNLLPLARTPGLWPLVAMMVAAAGGAMGLYSVLPTFLATERGFSTANGNLLLSVSRVASLGMVFAAGWLVDRLGRWRALLGVGSLAAVTTIGVGVLHGPALVVAVVLQPMGCAAIFPAAFTVLADLGPPQMRNVVISMVVPFVYGLGAGVVPSLLGVAGAGPGFARGIILLGAGFVVAVALVGLSRWQSRHHLPR